MAFPFWFGHLQGYQDSLPFYTIFVIPSRVEPEELVRASLEDLLSRPLDDFQKMVERVLSKNADLYKRLA